MDIGLFLGRFHPLVIHLPITLVLLGALFHFLSRRLAFERLGSVVNVIWFLAAVSAILSVIFGWLVAGDKGYEPQTLFLHRWLGVTVAVGATLLWLVQIRWVKLNPRHYQIGIVFTALAVAMTGHLGGSLTHGEGYLTRYGPDFIRQMFAGNQQEMLAGLAQNPDSIVVYRDVISRILVSRCGNCHNADQMKGGLDLMTQEGFEAGGDNGPIVQGKAHDSELMIRVTLPPDHGKFMPPQGTPLSYTEIALIKWWVDETQASFETRISELDKGSDLVGFLQRDYAIDARRKPVYELIVTEPLDEATITDLKAAGLVTRPIAQGNNYLDVTFGAGANGIESDQFAQLLAARQQVTWLDLANAGIADNHLEVVGQLEYLTRLKLNSNEISDAALEHLKDLKYLESLNLYDTQVTDDGLEWLEQITSLKRVYLWQTEVTAEGAARLQEKRPDLEINLGADRQI